MDRNRAHVNDGTAGFDDAWYDWKGCQNLLEKDCAELGDLHKYLLANSKAKNKSLLNRSGCNRFVSNFCRFTNNVGR